jgi:hypothetical protein
MEQPVNEEDKYKAARRLHEQARQYRGRFLNSVACIEHDLARLLTDYLCSPDESKRILFYENVATKFSLEEKKRLLLKIVEADYPNYWEEHEGILKSLSEIQTFRNKLAHSIIDVSDEALARPLDQGVGFVQWQKAKPVTEREFEEWDVKAGMVLSCLKEIQTLLPFKQRRSVTS